MHHLLPSPPGHVQVLSMLVKEGQDPEVEDVYGQTPLHLASLRGNVDVAEYLIIEVRQLLALSYFVLSCLALPCPLACLPVAY